LKWFSYLFCRASREISYKNIKSTRGVHFTILPASPCAAEFHEIWHTKSAHRLNHVVKFLINRFRGYGVLTSPKLPFPIDLLRRAYNSIRTTMRHGDGRSSFSLPTISTCMVISGAHIIVSFVNIIAIKSLC